MISIYKITDCNGLCYVGSTKQTVRYRLLHHIYDKRNGKYYSSSKLDLENCEIEVIEECDPEIRYEREQYYIENTDCVNEIGAKYKGRNIEKKKNYDCKRLSNIKDKTSQYDKKRREYLYSWGGSYYRQTNNLLKIDVNLFQ